MAMGSDLVSRLQTMQLSRGHLNGQPLLLKQMFDDLTKPASAREKGGLYATPSVMCSSARIDMGGNNVAHTGCHEGGENFRV